MLDKLHDLKEDVEILKKEPLLATDSGKDLQKNLDNFHNSVIDAITKFKPKDTRDLSIAQEYKLEKAFHRLSNEFDKIQDAIDVINELAKDSKKPKEEVPEPKKVFVEQVPEPKAPEEPVPQEEIIVTDTPPPAPSSVENKSFLQKILGFFENIFKKK